MSTYSLQATNDPHGILMLVELAFNGQAPVRVVSDTRNWTVAGQEYIALPVRIRLPRQDGGENPLAELQIDNVGRGFTELLESLTPGDVVQVTISMTDRNATGSKSDLFVGQANGARIDASTVSLTIGDDSTMRAAAIRRRFDLTTAPALWPR